MAEGFHQRNLSFGHENRRMLSLSARPEDVLATLFDPGRRDEAEVIVDPAGAVGRYQVVTTE